MIERDVQPVCYGVDECGKMASNSPWWWRQMAYKGKIASIKLGAGRGSRLLIPKSEVDRILREGLRPRLDSK